MADSRVSDLTGIAGSSVDVDNDLLPIIDVSAAVATRSKKISAKELVANTPSFLQSGTGASTTTVQTELRRLWYPEQFGAAGDGLTDDAAAWAALILAAGDNAEIHGTPGKTYLLGSAGITLTSKTNVRIVANGAKFKFNAAATQTMGGFGSTMIKFDTCTNSGIVGWTIDGNSKATNSIGFTACSGCFAERNKISASGINAQIVAINNTKNRYIENDVSSAAGTARGLWLGNTNTSEVETDAVIRGNRCYSNPATGIGGVFNGCLITENHCITNAGAGIALGAVADPLHTRKTIVSLNICRDNTFHGIQSDASTDAQYTEFIECIGNTCEENDQGGIYALRVRDWVISSNICRDNNFDGSGSASGIEIDRAKRVIAIGNICCDTRAGGSRTQTHGISVVAQVAAADVEDVLLVGNHCRNNTSGGINVTNSGSGTIIGISIVGNYANDNATNGVHITDAATGDITEVTVVGNHAVGNGTSDLRIDPPDAVIESNRFVLSPAATLSHTFTAQDATPSVKGRNLFRTNNGSATTITAFDDGVYGQRIHVRILDANTTVDFTGTTLKGNAGSDWSPGNGDFMECVFDGTNWYCQVTDATA